MGREAVGFVPARVLLSDVEDEEGRVVMMFSVSGCVRSCAADMEGRNLRGVTDPLAPSRVNEEISSSWTAGPGEE